MIGKTLLVIVCVLGVVLLLRALGRYGGSSAESRASIRRIFLYSSGILVLTLLLAGIIFFGTILGFITVIPWLAHQLSAQAGLNIWLAYIVTIPIGIVMVLSAGWLLSTGKRSWGIAAGSGVLIIWCSLMYTVTKDYNFDPVTMEAIKCYTVGLAGYEEVPCEWKVHPITTAPVERITREIAISMEIMREGPPTFETIRPTKDMRFVTPDGTPLVWYYEHPDGKIDLFGEPGVHPQVSTQLNPINSGIVKKILDHLDKGKIDMVYTPKTQGSGIYAPDLNAIKDLQGYLKDLRSNINVK